MTVADYLGQWELFSHFTAPQLEQLAPCVSLGSCAEGEVIVRLGDPTLEAYVIASGAIAIQRDTPYGVFSFARLGAGDIFGETAFVDRLVRSNDAVAAEPSELLRLNPVTLGSLVEGDRGLGTALYWTFWKSLSRKLRDTNEKLGRFFSESAPAAAAAAPADGGPAPDIRVDLQAKRQVFVEQRLSSLEINFLASLSREVALGPGELIFREGDEGDSLYVVLEGRVMISKMIPGAGEEALAFLERGDYFGEMALIDKQPRSADAKADTGGAVVLAIPGDVLEGILDIHSKVASPRLLRVLCSMVAHRLRELDDKIAGWFMLSGGAA